MKWYKFLGLILLFLAGLFVGQKCNRPVVEKVEIRTIIDTIRSDTTIYLIQPIAELELSFVDRIQYLKGFDFYKDSISLELDSLRIVEDFQKQRVYHDTINIDSVINLRLIDTIGFNRLLSRSYSYEAYRVTKEKDQYLEYKPPLISFGISTELPIKTEWIQINGLIIFSKKYSLSIGLNSKSGLVLGGGVLF